MKKIGIILLLFLPVLQGCAVIQPWVQEFNVISVPEETKIGQEAAKQVATQMRVSQDTALISRIRNLGTRLVQALPRQDYAYEFNVIEDKSPNAFTIPGGKIYVHTGLINFAQSDEEIAGVMAHEIGHAYQRHPAKLMSRQYGVEALSQVLFKGNSNHLKAIALQVAQGSLINYYGRQDEFEADETGFYILRRAGIPSRGLVSFFTRLQKLESGGSSFAFMSSHPPTQERINRLQQLEAGTRQPTLVFEPSAN